MLDLIFKIIKPATRIGVSNLKYEIEKANLAKFGNNVKYLLDDISSNYSIIIDKREPHEDYVGTSLGLYCQVQSKISIVSLTILRMIGTQEHKC